MTYEFFVFTRCYAKAGLQQSVAATIQEVLRPTRQEPGCMMIDAFGSTGDQRLFYIYSRWKDEAAFENHLQLPHTLRFLDAIQASIDQPMEVARTERLRWPEPFV